MTQDGDNDFVMDDKLNKELKIMALRLQESGDLRGWEIAFIDECVANRPCHTLGRFRAREQRVICELHRDRMHRP